MFWLWKENDIILEEINHQYINSLHVWLQLEYWSMTWRFISKQYILLVIQIESVLHYKHVKQS